MDKPQEINFQPIFDYIDESAKNLEERLVKKIENTIQFEVRDVKASIANLSFQVKKYHEEMLGTGHRIDRLEDWAKIVGEKVGVPVKF